MYAQGDILLVPAEVGKGLKGIKPKSVIVGYGEASGHSHVVCGEDVQWLVNAIEDTNSLHKFALGERDDNPQLFIEVPQGGVLNHMANGQVIEYDHKPIKLPAGTYRVVRQRQATLDGVFRPVID